MAKYSKFVVAADTEGARSILQETLAQQQFRFSWESPQRGLAEKGSKVKAMLLGAFSVYYPYSLQIDPNPDGTVTVSLFLASTGMMGGAVGVAKVRNGLDSLSGAVRSAYESRGVLRSAEIG
ncbi:hypothetical protein [Actinorugispora endophytica]|uniref:Uncharacterized protein n=1 Tax=Actinorugispora endophytica TaxID=1605990 RepID=A0A4V3D8L9_9ACTN|nr:hypothetical protein [Actinorugispora endophytica]TDQ52024.1 hypothetical protein EV190_1085 [Actinorugispora endophytica]